MPYYVLDDNNNKIEAYSKEEILSVIAQAVQDGSLANIVADAGFISKIKCCVGGQTFKEAFITQAKYNELKANNQLIENCLYNIIDDTTADDINDKLELIDQEIDDVNSNVEDLDSLLNSANYEINSIKQNYRRIDRARQYIDLEGIIYNTSVSTQPRLDISSKMLTGETSADVVGIGGKLNITVNGSDVIVFFSTLFNQYSYGSGNTVAAYNSGNGTTYLFKIEIGLDTQKNIYMTSCEEILNSNTSVSKVTISDINLYYK